MRSTRLKRDVEAHLRAAELTYDQVGATSGALPPGYHHLIRRVVIGKGAARFVAAADALLGWQMHLRSGLQVSASSGLVVPGPLGRLAQRRMTDRYVRSLAAATGVG